MELICNFFLQPRKRPMGPNRSICAWTLDIRCTVFHFIIRSKISININQVRIHNVHVQYINAARYVNLLHRCVGYVYIRSVHLCTRYKFAFISFVYQMAVIFFCSPCFFFCIHQVCVLFLYNLFGLCFFIRFSSVYVEKLNRAGLEWFKYFLMLGTIYVQQMNYFAYCAQWSEAREGRFRFISFC